MKLSDVVKDGVKDLEAQLREIRRNEEDDLGKLADSFDAVAKAADLVAAKIANAETALGEDPGEDSSAPAPAAALPAAHSENRRAAPTQASRRRQSSVLALGLQRRARSY